MDTDNLAHADNLIWEFASAGVYVALEGRFKVCRRRFAELPGWYLIDNERQKEMRLDSLRLAQHRAYWIHNQHSIGEHSIEDVITVLDMSDVQYGFIAYLSFAKGIVAIRKSRTRLHVKLFFDNNTQQIVSKDIDKGPFQAQLVKHAGCGVFDAVAIALSD